MAYFYAHGVYILNFRRGLGEMSKNGARINTTIFYTEMTIKIDLRSFFMSEASKKKHTTQLFKSKFQYRTYFFFT